LDEIQIQKIVKKILNGLESLHKARKIYNAPSLNNICINFENKAPPELGNNLSIFRKYYDELIEDNEDINYEIKIKYFISTSERKKFIESEENSDHQKIQYYLAPEILKNNDDDTNPVAADMWSVGMITYKLLLGGNKLDMLESPKNGYISFPNNLCPSFEIIHFITSLLKMDPKERPTFETIKNHDFLKRKPEEFDFLNLELISQTQNNGEPIKLLLNKKFSIYKYLINTTMDYKIDKLMRFEIEKEFLLDKKITIEKNIQNLKNQIEECRNLKNSHKEEKKLNNLLEKCVNDFKLNEERLNNIQNNLKEN
jgi:serine/threonine protein kinase